MIPGVMFVVVFTVAVVVLFVIWEQEAEAQFKANIAKGNQVAATDLEDSGEKIGIISFANCKVDIPCENSHVWHYR
ncbi:hypothetical protein E4U41_006443 [Claviceps citrina]|nr:hypothetical protein E4U41_006443 [Claviceps citrina]